MRLAGKVAIVTGGGQGVGRGIALAMAKEGATVAIAGRTVEKCENVVREIEGFGGKGLALGCRIHRREQVEEAVGKVTSAFGRIDVLVNNAHRSRTMVPTDETSDEDLALGMEGFYGSFYFMRACFPWLKQARGAVINLGSVSALRGDAGFMAYAAAKEAIRGMSRVAAREWGPYGIRVNVICPFSDSPGVERMSEKDPAFVQQLIDDTAMRRLGSSELDVGRTAVFLASDDGTYITGQTISIDGGIWMVP